MPLGRVTFTNCYESAKIVVKIEYYILRGLIYQSVPAKIIRDFYLLDL